MYICLIKQKIEALGKLKKKKKVTCFWKELVITTLRKEFDVEQFQLNSEF